MEEQIKPKVKSNKFVKFLMTMIAVITSSIGLASATIATDIDNFTTIIGNTSYGITGWVVSMMNMFLQPPLVYFVTMGIFITIVGIVAGLLLRRGRRR